jgi:hypothetical protein
LLRITGGSGSGFEQKIFVSLETLCRSDRVVHAADAIISRSNATKQSSDLSPSWPGIAVRRTASLPLAYVPAIHVFGPWKENKTWITATSAVTTAVVRRQLDCFAYARNDAAG